jgi:hypothetical protein
MSGHRLGLSGPAPSRAANKAPEETAGPMAVGFCGS